MQVQVLLGARCIGGVDAGVNVPRREVASSGSDCDLINEELPDYFPK